MALSLTVVSAGGNHVFRVPMLDPAAMPSSTGGYPWIISETASTVIYVKNTATTTRSMNFRIMHNDGEYSLGTRTLQPDETVVVDVRYFRDEQIPDSEENFLPITADRGQVYWSTTDEEEVTSLIGRAEQYDPTRGVSSSYACLQLCPDSYRDGVVLPPNPIDQVGGQRTFEAFQLTDTTFGLPFTTPSPLPEHQVLRVTWFDYIPGTTTDSPVVEIDSTGRATALQPGVAEIVAVWSARVYVDTCGGDPPPNPELVPACCHALVVEGGGSTLFTVENFDFTVTLDKGGLYPSGTGESGANSATVTVQTSPPVSGKTVKFSAVYTDLFGLGGHRNHTGNKPTGSLSAATGVTDAQGRATVTYTSSPFAGTIEIRADIGGRVRVPDDILTVAVPDLQRMAFDGGCSQPYGAGNDRHPQRHFGTAGFIAALEASACQYMTAIFGPFDHPPERRVGYNDMSLPAGGKFEADARNWCTGCDHQQHRIGRNADVTWNNVEEAWRPTLLQAWADKHLNVAVHGGDHWHLTLQPGY